MQRIQTEGGPAEGQNRLCVYYRQVQVLVSAAAKVTAGVVHTVFLSEILSFFYIYSLSLFVSSFSILSSESFF